MLVELATRCSALGIYPVDTFGIILATVKSWIHSLYLTSHGGSVFPTAKTGSMRFNTRRLQIGTGFLRLLWHWLIRDYTVRFSALYNSHCRRRGDEGKTVRHFLSDFAALGRVRQRTLVIEFSKRPSFLNTIGWDLSHLWHQNGAHFHRKFCCNTS